MTKAKIFLALAGSFILGIFIRSFWEADFLLWGGILLVLAVILSAVFYRNKITVVLIFSFLALILGMMRIESGLQEINSLPKEAAEFSGKVIIIKEPERKDKYLQIIGKNSAGEKLLITAGLYADFSLGDEVAITCQKKIPENRDSSFDYRMYLAKDGIFFQCQSAEIKKIASGQGNKFYSYLIKIKSQLEKSIDRLIPQPEAGLANGLIFGGGKRLTENTSRAFSRTGMTHIVAVSGYNVTIIAEYLMLLGIFLGLWRRQAFWFAVGGIVLFVLAIGFPSSAVRAGVMGTLLLWAMKNGRLANATNAIIFSAAIMLLFNPLLLRWDIGFQLSFLATLGIVFLAPWGEKFIFKKYNLFGWQEILLLSISAQIFVLPIIAYNFQTVSLVSLVANILVLPIVPLSMLLVFLTAVAGAVSYFLALPLAWLAYLPLHYEIGIIKALSSLSWASVEAGKFNGLLIVIYYLILGWIIWCGRNKIRKNVKA